MKKLKYLKFVPIIAVLVVIITFILLLNMKSKIVEKEKKSSDDNKVNTTYVQKESN